MKNILLKTALVFSFLFFLLFESSALVSPPKKTVPALSSIKKKKSSSYLSKPVFYFPVSASLGGSGRAGVSTAEYHQLNSASTAQGPAHKLSGLYFFDDKGRSLYGGSISSKDDLPLAFSWMWDGGRHHYLGSVAGRLSKKWTLGAGLYHLSEDKDFFPHLGLLYQPWKSFSLGLTGDKVKDKIIYGAGFYYSFQEVFNIQGDLSHIGTRQLSLGGGMEWKTKNNFSVRVGQSWPQTSWRFGLSFHSKPIGLDYAWIQNTGHSLALRLESL